MCRMKKMDLMNSIYYQIPKCIMKLFLMGEISSKGFKIYTLMYERAKLSAVNGWIDEDGSVFLKYSQDELFKDLIAPGKTTVTRGLKELEKLKLIEKKTGENIYYLSKKKNTEKTISISNNNTSNNNKINNNNNNNNNKITTIENKIVDFLTENNINQATIRNILKLKNIDFDKVKEVIRYAKYRKWGGGAIYRALQENWILSSKREECNDKIDEKFSEDLEEKRRWLNYFGGIDMVMKAELLEAIKIIPMEKLVSCKSELCRMTPRDFRSFLLNLSRRFI